MWLLPLFPLPIYLFEWQFAYTSSCLEAHSLRRTEKLKHCWITERTAVARHESPSCCALTELHCKWRRLPFEKKIPPSVSKMTAGIKVQLIVGYCGSISWVHCGPKIVGFVGTNDFLEAFIFRRGHALMHKKGQRVINESGKGFAHFE